MSSKRPGPRLMIGSLERNFWQYIIKTEFNFNKKDPPALNYLRQFKYQFYGKNKQKNLNPNFEVKLKQISGVNNHSFVKHTWLNNYEYKFYIYDKNDVKKMFDNMGFINILCENQRAIEGHDDELEDEEKIIM
jgi:hypothetical protein